MKLYNSKLYSKLYNSKLYGGMKHWT